MPRQNDIQKALQAVSNAAKDVATENAGQPINTLIYGAITEIHKTLQLLALEVAELRARNKE